MYHFLDIPEWGDGQAPPAISITAPTIPGFSAHVQMPPVLKAVKPAIETPGPMKKARYTGRIHKAIRGAIWTATFDWVFFANKIAKTTLGVPIGTYTYLDILDVLIQADMLKDYYPAMVNMQLMVHSDYFGDGGDFRTYLWNFRLNGKVKRKALDDKTVVEQVSVPIITDGWIEELPIHVRVAPVI